MRGTFLNAGLHLSHLQDMVHRLVGQPVIRQGIKTADSREQWSLFLTAYLIDPRLQSLLGPGWHIRESFFIAFSQHPERTLMRDNVT